MYSKLVEKYAQFTLRICFQQHKKRMYRLTKRKLSSIRLQNLIKVYSGKILEVIHSARQYLHAKTF
jgi:hypothetical protein